MSYAIVTKEDEKSYKIRDFLIDKIKDEYDETKPTKVITVGGDGTFLKAVHMFEKNIDNIVFFIYNTGHLGYFSNYDDDSLNALILFSSSPLSVASSLSPKSVIVFSDWYTI